MEVINMDDKMMNVKENAYGINEYSIHTVEVGIRLSRNEAFELKDKLKAYGRRYCENIIPDKEGSHRTTKYNCIRSFFEKGISHLRVEEHYIDNGYVCGYLLFKLNPRLLLGYEDYRSIAIVPVGELENIMPALINVWKKYLSMDVIKRAILLRVDFCCNIKMDNHKQAQRFIKLLSQAKEPAGMEYQYYYDLGQHRKRKCGNGITLKGKQCEIAIYLKQKQMIYQNKYLKGCHSKEEIQLAEGQLRFELRVWRRKVHYISGRYLECADTANFFENAAMLSKKFLNKYLLLMYGSGRFVKMSEARKIIMGNRSLHMDTRRNYISLIEAVKKAGQDVYFLNLKNQDMKAYYTAVRWRKEIGEKFGISLITMPECWSEECFENPITYIKVKNLNDII